jgi:hypothetical protein
LPRYALCCHKPQNRQKNKCPHTTRVAGLTVDGQEVEVGMESCVDTVQYQTWGFDQNIIAKPSPVELAIFGQVSSGRRKQMRPGVVNPVTPNSSTTTYPYRPASMKVRSSRPRPTATILATPSTLCLCQHDPIRSSLALTPASCRTPIR